MSKSRSLPAGALVALLVLLSTALRSWAGLTVHTPWIAPDELIYGNLGQNLYSSGRLELIGQPAGFYGLVTPALAGLPLSIGDLERGYDALKVVHALVMSLAAVPVYLWGRAFLSRGWALAAAALTLAVPGLVYSGLVMTEVAFYPVLLLAAWSLARALERPTLARQALLLAAIVLAAATRLQAVVLVPALFTALGVKLLLERTLAPARRFWPSAAGVALLALLWSGWRLRHGGPLSNVLGAYRAAGEVHYTVAESLRYVAYQAEDVLVFSAVVPVCAFALLLGRALAGRESSEAVRAYLATTIGVGVWTVAEVGVFSSRHIGQLAERNLFGLAPLLFLGLCLWLQRGGPRPRLATAAVALGAWLVVLALPVERFTTMAALPESFSLVWLVRLVERHPGLDAELILTAAAAFLAAAFALVPRRLLLALPALLAAIFAVESVWTSRVVSAEAAKLKPATVGADLRWIDRRADGRVAFLYSGDVLWISAWENAFWNRRVRAVYDLLDAQVPGGIPQQSVGPYEEGSLVFGNGTPAPADYVVASRALTFFGEKLADSSAGISLWRVDPPLRLSTWTQGLRSDGVIESHVRVVVYACRGGTLELTVVSPQQRTITFRRNDRPFAQFQLARGETSPRQIPAAPPSPVGQKLCTFDVLTSGPVQTSRFVFDPAAG